SAWENSFDGVLCDKRVLETNNRRELMGIPAEAGANVIVSGTGVIKAPCQKTAISQLREAVQAAIAKGF
ncbi:hypothetical protein ANCDUO_17384, partial [Ancylostoma duodenale]